MARVAVRGIPEREPSVLARPIVSFGREICGDLASALRREWIVTNGLGGYASGTLAGINTRRYHGLLVAALTPPVGRTVLVGGLVERTIYGGGRYPLSSHEYIDGTIDPRGYVHQRSFRLDGMLPVWEFELADAVLEKRVWMRYGANTACVSYRLIRATGPLDLEITPLVTYRDFHALRSGHGWTPEASPVPGGVRIHASADAVPYRLVLDGGEFTATGDWYWNFLHREEAARGLDSRSDLYAPGVFRAQILAGQGVTLVATTEADEASKGAPALEAARARQEGLLRRAGVDSAHPVVQQLTLAADQFIVARSADHDAGKTTIAGYHWFNDWGRDTMISLPGLTLCTGRSGEGAGILREFARFVKDGLLPNNFPDRDGQIPGYNTADASLWYVLAVRAYHEATGDDELLDDLLPTVREILDRHIAGTRYGIAMDPSDGLLRAGEPGVQLTWMDAKVGDWVVTPRIGKPVEINALWYNALRAAAAFMAPRRGADRYAPLADRVRGSFRARFLQPDARRLADVIDGPGGDDLTMRPNQIFAVSLPFALLDGVEAAAVVEAVGKMLLTTYGLRSLSPDAPAYRGEYGGDVVQRDGAYHQGPVWSWLIGAYADAHYRVHRSRDAALALLRPFEDHLRDAGLGTASEIFDGNAPHYPRGCIAQAWSVAEVLRVWRRLDSLERGAP